MHLHLSQTKLIQSTGLCREMFIYTSKPLLFNHLAIFLQDVPNKIFILILTMISVSSWSENDLNSNIQHILVCHWNVQNKMFPYYLNITFVQFPFFQRYLKICSIYFLSMLFEHLFNFLSFFFWNFHPDSLQNVAQSLIVCSICTWVQMVDSPIHDFHTFFPFFN